MNNTNQYEFNAARRSGAERRICTYHRHFGRKDIGGQADGYPDVQAFMATYREAEAVVEQYNHSLAEWERHVKEKHRPSKMPKGKVS